MLKEIKNWFLDLINYCDCPFDPDDNPFPQSCDRRIRFSNYCLKDCPWAKYMKEMEGKINMGDKITIKKVEFLYGHLFQIDLLNETKNKTDRMFIEKEELYKMLEKAENDYGNIQGQTE